MRWNQLRVWGIPTDSGIDFTFKTHQTPPCANDKWQHLCSKRNILVLSHYSSRLTAVKDDLWCAQAGITTAGCPGGRMLRWIVWLLMTAGSWESAVKNIKPVTPFNGINFYRTINLTKNAQKCNGATSTKQEKNIYHNDENSGDVGELFFSSCFPNIYDIKIPPLHTAIRNITCSRSHVHTVSFFSPGQFTCLVCENSDLLFVLDIPENEFYPTHAWNAACGNVEPNS